MIPVRSGALRARLGLAVSALALAACGSSTSTPRTVYGGARKVLLQVPASYDGSKALPLLIILHGYGANGAVEQSYLGLDHAADTAGLFVLAPDGTLDSSGQRFWNATDACCNFEANPVDDVAYLKGLIAGVESDYKVDARRVFLLGHSNGAFMSYRMACADAPAIAAIVSLAGATYLDAAACAPSRPVSVLQVHGTADETILYGGGTPVGGTKAYPGAVDSVTRWQAYDGCAPGLVAAPASASLDLVPSIPGAETQVAAFAGCPAGIGVELWTMNAATHIPLFGAAFAADTLAWLGAHPKP